MQLENAVKSVFLSCSACAICAIAALFPSVAEAGLLYEPDSYAARGSLLLQLDGIRNVGLLKAHDNASGSWVDLVAGKKVYFGYKTGSGVTSEWAEDGYVFGGGDIGQLYDTVNPGNAFTIQVVCDVDKSGQTAAYPHYFGVADDKCNIYTYKSTDNNRLIYRVRAVSDVTDVAVNPWVGRQHYITALYDKGKTAVFNTETGSVASGATETSVGAQRFCIGGVYKSDAGYMAERYLNGTIKAVRIYGKVLSTDELKQNRALDEARFFNGIPVTNVVVATSVAGLHGNVPAGVYAIDGDGYTFTAPKKASLNGLNYVCTGYTLEIWDGVAWGAPVRYGETSYTASDASAKVRLTWLWQNAAAASVSTDLDPLFDGYVTDGLILHLDGIRNAGAPSSIPHDNTATAWIDLAGGKTATFYSDETDESRWTDDGYWFGGRSYAKFAEQLTGLTNTVTVQVVCEADTNELAAAWKAQKTFINWPMLVGCNDNDTLNVYYDKNNGNDKLTFKNVNTGNVTLGKGTWEGRYATAIRNGASNYILQGVNLSEAAVSGTGGGNIGSATVYVGSAGSTLDKRSARWFRGKIKAVRIYDRVLSDAELAANRAIDEVRFFGAAAPVTNVVVASSVRGVSGDVSEGAYALVSGGRTFTAPASATLGDDAFACTGYTLETWNGAAWGEPERFAAASCTLSDTTAKVRLTWQWSHTAGPGYDLAFNDYVTDGLVIHLDGIRNAGLEAVHDSGAATWTDLASADGYAGFAGVDSTCGWVQDGYRFNGRTASPAYAAMNATRTLGAAFTAQAVVDFDANASHRINTAWPHLFGTTAASGDPFDMYYNQNNNSNPGVNFKVNNTHVRNGGVKPWGGEYMTGMSDGVNGALFQTVAPDATGAFNKTVGTQTFTFAGGNGGDNGYVNRRFTGTYKSARLYDRALTNAELAQNRAVDEVRFFGRSPAATGDLVVSSTVEGLAGNLPCGAYRPVSGYVFAAPAEGVLDGTPYELKGYTLETWNGSEWADAETVNGGTSVSPDVSSASKRLTWNWAVKSRLTRIRDSFDVGDYVQDGLYLHFDGIRNAGAAEEHSDAASTWVNLGTGGADFNAAFDHALYASAGDGWAKDGYNFVYGGKFAVLGANPSINYFTTIQIVCEAEPSGKPSGQKYPTYFGSTNDYLNIYGFGPVAQAFFKVFNGSRVELAPSYSWKGGYLTAIWNAGANQIFQEAVPAPSGWSNSWRSNWNGFSGQPFYIGGIYIEGNEEGVNQRRLTGKIQAVRVYNRMLSDEELEQNRLVDEARFKGNLPESNVTIATRYGDGAGETLAEAVGNYMVEGSYTFSASQVFDASGALVSVRGYWLQTLTAGGWGNRIWSDGQSFVYNESMGKVRVLWSPRREGVLILVK